MIIPVLDKALLAHPRSAGQGYFEHLWFAWRFGATMLRGALAAFGHGLLPCVLTANASRAVRDLHARLEMPRDALDGLRPSKTV